MLKCLQRSYIVCLSSILFLNCSCLIHCFSNVNADNIAPRPGWIDPFDMLGESRLSSDNNMLVKSDVKADIIAPRPGWIDPHEMLGETRLSSDNLLVQSDIENHVTKNRLIKCESYLRRFINSFLQSIELKDSTPSTDSHRFVKMEFVISKQQLSVLRNFGNEVNNGANIESVSDVLTNLFIQNPRSQDRHYSYYNLLLKWLHTIAKSPEWTVVSSIAVMMFVTLWFLYKTHSYRLAMTTLFLIIFFAGFGFNWIRMYEEKEAEKYYNNVKHGGDVPKHCSGQLLVWYEHMYYRMFGDDCEKFYKTRDVRTIVQISPTDVLAETFSSMIINPAICIGKAYGNFITNVIDAVPWWLTPFAIPLIFIIPPVSIFGILLLLFSYRISLSWTGFHLTPCLSHGNALIQERKDQYVEDISHKVLSDNKSPLFLVNWLGLKKLMTNVVLVDKDNCDEKDSGLDSKILNETGVKRESENPSQTESLVKLVDKQNEPCKKRPRSIHTVVKEGTPSSSSEENVKNDYLDENSASGGKRK